MSNKWLKIAVLVLAAGIALPVLAAPIFRVERTLLPETNNAFELGTSTRQWLRVFTESLCLNGDCRSAWPSGSGGSGTISTSTAAVQGNLLFFSGPSTVANVATGTLSVDSNFSISATRSLVGGAATISLAAGRTIPLSASTTEWTNFFNTPSTRITDGTGLTWSGNTLNCDTANGSTFGCLTAADWTTFNSKQDALGFTPVPNTRSINTTYPLQGGGNLTADRTLSLAFGTTTANTWSQAQTFTSGFVNNATSSGTFGINITGGCFAVNGVCIGGGSGTGASTTLLADSNTFSGLNAFTNSGTTSFTGGISASRVSASATSTLAGLRVNAGGFAISTLNCTGFVNGGKLTTDSLGNVSCGDDTGGGAGGITQLGPAGQLQSGSTQTLATSTGSFNGLTAGITIIGSGNTQTFTPSLSGTLGVLGGGTGATSFTAGNLIYGAGTGALQTVATTTLTASGPLSLSQPISVIGPSASTLSLSTSGDWTGTLDGFEGLTLLNGRVSTSSVPTVGNLAYWTGNGTPSTLGSVATGTVSSSGGITTTAGRSVIGGALSIACDVAGSGQPGCLSAADWSTFNSKLSAAVTSIGPAGQLQTGPAVTIATTSDTNIGLTVTGSGNTLTFLSQWFGTLADSRVADNLTISGGTVNNTPIGAVTPSTGVFTLATTTQATTTNLYVSGSGTSTVLNGSLDIAGSINERGSATSTFTNGISISGGCFAVNGTCLSTGGATSPGGANTNVQFNNSGSFGGSNAFVWDNVNNRLGVGTSTTSYGLHVAESRNDFAVAGVLISNPNSGTQAIGGLTFANDQGEQGYFALNSSNFAIPEYQNSFVLTANRSIYFNSNNRDVFFQTGANTRMVVASTSNVGIGTSSPYARLSVVGDVVAARFVATTTATSSFTGGLDVRALNVTGTASSTFANGINLTSGCFAVNGVCIGSSGTGASTTLLADNNTWTGFNNFGRASTTLFSSLGPVTVGTTSTTTIWGNATSTFTGGINLTNGGCFAINGTCLSTGGSSGTESWLTVRRGVATSSPNTGRVATTVPLTAGQILRVTGDISINCQQQQVVHLALKPSTGATTTVAKTYADGCSIGTYQMRSMTGEYVATTSLDAQLYFGLSDLSIASTTLDVYSAGTSSIAYQVLEYGTAVGGGGGGGGGNSKWSTSTNGLFLHPNATAMDLVLGSNSTSTAPFWFDVSATTTYIGNGGSDSILQLGSTNNAWSVGNFLTDNSFRIASSTDLSTNVALTLVKGGRFGIGTTSPAFASTISIVPETGRGGIMVEKSDAIAGFFDYPFASVSRSSGNLGAFFGTYHDSASPASGDFFGGLDMYFDDAGGNRQLGSYFNAQIINATANLTDTRLAFGIQKGGVGVVPFFALPTGAVIDSNTFFDETGAGATGLGNNPNLDTLLVAGSIRSNQSTFGCDPGQAIAQIAADTVTACQGLMYAEDAAGVSDTVSSAGNGAYFRLRPGAAGTVAAAGDGMGLSQTVGTMRINSTTTPTSVEFIARPGASQNASSSFMLLGLSSSVGINADFASQPANFVGFVASSTAANWVATCGSSGTFRMIDTGIASSTVTTGDGAWRQFRIVASSTSVAFYIQPATRQRRAFTSEDLVATCTTNIPTGTMLGVTAGVGKASAGNSNELHVGRIRAWWNDDRGFW